MSVFMPDNCSIFSIINTSGTLGGVVFPPLFGWILDRYAVLQNEAPVPGYHVLFPVVAGMYVVSALCWLGINCSRQLDGGGERVTR